MEKDSLIRPNAPSRNKKPARFYYVLMVLVFMVLFLDSVISLGSLGVVQQRLHNLSPVSKCILFGSRGIDYDNDVVIYLPNVGACAFVLWGQVSIVVVSFVWIVLYISQAVIAPRV